jgi:hypothetical protein
MIPPDPVVDAASFRLEDGVLFPCEGPLVGQDHGGKTATSERNAPRLLFGSDLEATRAEHEPALMRRVPLHLLVVEKLTAP